MQGVAICKRVELAEAGRSEYLGAGGFLTFPVLYLAITYQMSRYPSNMQVDRYINS